MASSASSRSGRTLRDTIVDLRPRQSITLLDAPPLSGATRLMYEAATQKMGDHRVIQQSATELITSVRAGLLDNLPRGDRYLVWLDDLSPGDLILLANHNLEAMSRRATVLASINRHWFRLLADDTSPLTACLRSMLRLYITHISLKSDMSKEERRRTQAAYPNLALGSTLAESLVGGDALVRHYDSSAHAHPDGYALITTAVDARRAGVHRGFSEDEMRRMFVNTGDPKRRSNSAFPKAFSWATQIPHDATVAPLAEKAGSGGRAAIGYLAAAADGNLGHPVREVPEATWAALLDVLPRNDAFQIGVAAYLRGHAQVATAAFTKAADSHNEAIAEHGMLALMQMKTQRAPG
jgi:hypothetical protein